MNLLLNRSALVAALALFIAPPVHSDIRLPKIFSDNMVLQRETSVNIWGWAEAGEQLTITIEQSSVSTTADDQGNWSAQITAPAAGGPFELVVAGAEAQVGVKTVLVGEVWIGAGQSNMAWPLTQAIEFENDEAREQFIAEINDSRLRLFTVPAATRDKPATDFSQASVWQECRPETIRDFSGVAYFFAKHLRESDKLKDVPIGLINCSVGGTPCESWTSRDALKSNPKFEPLLQYWDAKDDDRSANRPCSLFNGMVAPLAPMSVRGAIWYQGESNVGRGDQYAELFPTMIKDWRQWFQQGDIPFFFVQLAPFRYKGADPRALAEIWDAQNKTLNVPNTGMVVTVDVGNVEDIHPKNKDVVGRRLAMLARSFTYGETDLKCFSPILSKFEFNGGQALLEFNNAEGLKFKNSEERGFTIAGDDNKFVPANAEIRDGKVIVWSDEVKKPLAVRYLWDDTAQASLFNGSDLPAAPFRTDELDLLSKDRSF